MGRISNARQYEVAHYATLQRISSLGGAALPFLIIGGLLYSAFFVKPKVEGVSVEPPVIERRDIFYGVAIPVPGSVWVAGNQGKIVRSDDGGTTWIHQATGVTAHLQSIAAWDPERAVAVGNDGTVVVTSDGGKTWAKTSMPANVAGAKLMRVRTYPGGKAWAVGEMGMALSSSDFGVNWRSTTAGEDVSWNDVVFVKDVGWLVGEFGRMQATRDGGANWKVLASPVKSSLNGVYFRDEHEGVAVGTEGVLLLTKDGGANWRVLPKIVDEHLYDVLWDGSRWIAVGDKGALLTAGISGDKWSDLSRDAGTTWHTQVVGANGSYLLAGYGVTKIDIDRDKRTETKKGKQ
ncbi:MAG: glycosyl hydrolase [Betaproteobacteria bacterium]|nr:glycosyl hydrolase [Betaproteobacteria bacterium]